MTDENNGIKLDDYFLDGRLLSQFTVQGIRPISSFDRHGDELILKLFPEKTHP